MLHATCYCYFTLFYNETLIKCRICRGPIETIHTTPYYIQRYSGNIGVYYYIVCVLSVAFICAKRFPHCLGIARTKLNDPICPTSISGDSDECGFTGSPESGGFNFFGNVRVFPRTHLLWNKSIARPTRAR